MLARRLVLPALLTGIVALGRPAAIAAQHPAALPLHRARAIVVVDAWEGFSPISPTRGTYRLVRSADGSFTGTVQLAVGAGLGRRDTSFAVRLPRPAVDSLLQALSDAPLREGATAPRSPTRTTTHRSRPS